MTLTFGESIGVAVAVAVHVTPLIVICVAIWRCCCGDNIFWRATKWCKGKSSETDSGQNGGTKIDARTSTKTTTLNCFSCCVNVHHGQQTVDSQPSVNVNVSPSGVDFTRSKGTLPSVPPEEIQPDRESDPMLPRRQTINDNQQVNSPPSRNETAQSATPQMQNAETTEAQHSAGKAVVTTDNPDSTTVSISAEVHQGNAPQIDDSPVTNEDSLAMPDEIDSSASQKNSSQPQPQSVATDNPLASASRTSTNQPQQQSTATVNPQAGASQKNFDQPQQLNPERCSMPSSSTSSNSTSGYVASQPTTKRSFSAKFVRELGKILNPLSPVDADWRLILIELGQSQGEVNQLTHMSDPTAEALHRWQEAGRTLDDLLQVFKENRLDAYKVIESFKKNNEAYSASSAEIVPQTPRHGDDIVTKEQLHKLANNLGSWDELALNLGISKGNIYKLKEGNRYSQWAQVYYMLEKWEDKEYKNATVGLLVQKCRETKTVDKEMYAFLLE